MSIFSKTLNNIRNDSNLTVSSTSTNTQLLDKIFGNSIHATEDKALALSSYFSGLQMMSSNMASLDGMVMQRYDDGQKYSRQNHPLQNKIEFKPNRYTNAYNFIKTFVLHMLLYGDGFARIEFEDVREDGRFITRPKSIHFEENRHTAIYKNKSTGEIKYRFTSPESENRWYDYNEVLHIYNFSLNGWSGLSYLEAGLRKNIEGHLSAQEFNNKYFKNNSFLGGILSTDDELGVDANANISAEDAAKIKQDTKSVIRKEWDQIYSGAEKAGKIAILEGNWKYEQLDLNAKDSQLVERVDLTVAEVGRILNIPLSMMNVKNSNSYNSVESDSKMYIQNAILPIKKILQEEFRSKLFTSREINDGYYIDFDHTQLENVTLADKAEFVKEMVINTVMDVNEARKYIKLDAKDEHNFSVVQKNVDIIDEDGTLRERNVTE